MSELIPIALPSTKIQMVNYSYLKWTYLYQSNMPCYSGTECYEHPFTVALVADIFLIASYVGVDYSLTYTALSTWIAFIATDYIMHSEF